MNPVTRLLLFLLLLTIADFPAQTAESADSRAGIDPGICEVTFPQLDKDVWTKI